MNSKKDQPKIHQPAPEIPMTEPLWTVDDVAAYLRLQHETVRMMARAKKIPAIKVGRAWRFRAADIRNMLRNSINP